MRRATIGLLVLTAACTAAASTVETESPTAATADTTIECDEGCSVQWKRADEWLARHSRLELVRSGDTLIRTAYQSRKYPIYHFIVSRPAKVSGPGAISLSLHCGNRIGCRPSADIVQQAFRQFVQTGVDSLPPQSRFAGIRE